MKKGQPGFEFSLLLSFIKGDARFQKQIRYIMSISDKIRIIDLFYNHVLKQIPLVESDFAEVQAKGQLVSTESSKLTGYYEAYLNAIYSFLENISRLTLPFYPGKNLPPSFYRQRKRFIENPELDLVYPTLLESMDWYEEVHGIRSESTHFLSGTITGNQNTPGYWNEPQGKRDGTPPEIDIEDLKEHVESIQQSVSYFIDKFGKIFLNKIDGDKEVIQLCRIWNGLTGFKWISLNQFLDGHPGRCHSIDLPCPDAATCKARENALKDN